MYRAYDGDKNRGPVETLGLPPVGPPKANRNDKLDYDRKLYKLRNEVNGCSEDSSATRESARSSTSST